MKLLLVVPPSRPERTYGKFLSIGTLYPSLGLVYLASYVEREGHEVKIIDSEADGSTYEDINRIALQFNPDLVGMQTYCTNINMAYKVAENLKKILDTKVVLGGAQATLDPVGAISSKFVDFVICGEGEKGLAGLLRSFEKENLLIVPGLVYKDEGEIKINKKGELIKNIDEIPIPARHLVPMEKYHSSANLRGKRTLNIVTSRGCPYRCAYCAGPLIFGKTHRFHSVGRVIEEMRLLKVKYKADSVQFFDETFTLNRKRVMELCDGMIKENLGLEWSCFTRVNLVDKELLYKMEKAGCYSIFYGLESGVQRLLDLVQKDITLEQSKEAIKITHEAGIETWASFMLGLPSETKEETEQTIDFAIKADPTFAQFPITTPFPGTKLYDLALQYGKLDTDWENFTTWDKVVFVTEGRTEREIEEASKRAYRRFYLRPTSILRRIKSMSKLPLKKSFALVKTAVSTFFK